MGKNLFFLEATADFSSEKLAHQLIADQARQYSDRIALVEGEKEMSYGELERITDSLAAGLIAAGVKPEEAVGIYIDRSINYITAILAIVKSGGCYVPIDPDIPADRLNFIIADTNCKKLFSESQYAEKLSGFTDKVIMLDKMDLSVLQPLSAPPEISLTSLAYIIYTSGSTGTPKGVEIEHHSLLNLVQWYHNTFIETGHYLASQSSGPGFDSAVCEIWSHLTNGATLYIIPEMLLLQPQKLVDWLTEKQINECFLSSVVAELLLSADWKNNTSLKYLQCGGEKLNKKPGSDFPALFSNRYGPTECTVDSTWTMFKAGDDDGKPPHIGVPISNFRIYILDEELNPVPRGDIGEICIGGAGLARGYRHLPELTAKAFVPDPFRHGERIYRSGDLGSINDDGNIEYYGRKDFQVKIRGYRIELGEVEAVLSQHKNVSKCVVIVKEKGDGIKYLAAYFILKQAQESRQFTEEFRNLLNESLPEYMIPATYTVLQAFPLTLNGKIDRKALPEPEFFHEKITAVDDAADPILKTLSTIWCQLLKLDYVTPEDNFFMLGGHSLLATALCLEIEKKLLVQLPVSIVFSHPVLKQLAQAVKYGSSSNRSSVKFEKVEVSPNNRYPASVAQTTMWFMEQSSPANNSFNIQCAIYLQGDVKPDILGKAFNLIIKRNEAFCTSFEFINDQLFLKINDFQKTKIPYHDLSVLPENEKQQRYNTEISIQRFQVFDLTKAPLFNCVLLKLKEHDFRFILTVYHLIVDGWSNFLFFKQMADYYQQFSLGKEPAAPAQSWQYVDFCHWQNNYLKTYIPQVQLKYWQKKLENLVITPPLPVQKRLPSKGKSKRYYVKINQDLTGRLKKLGTKNNSSLFMVLTALLQLQIHKYTGATDITTGTTIANRNLPETEEIIGLFINPLALRNKITGNPSFNEFLSQVKDTLLEAYENQDIPYNIILKNYSGLTQNGNNSFFNISLLLQNLPWPGTDHSEIKMCYDELGSDAGKVNIIIILEERAGELHGWYEYDTALFEGKDIEELFNNYLCLAESLSKNPHALISEIHLPPESIRHCPSCYIIGETAFAKAAGEILLDNEFYINGIFTDDIPTQAWADEHGIPCHKPQKKLISEIISSVRPDYLFSVVNGCILDRHILDQPLKYAINFHDSLLPRYAGLNSTVWAIINHEEKHGVTWHQMTEGIDTGDIFKQREVTISPADTTGSLNVKCTKEALNTFKSLVDDLKNDSVMPTPQDLTKATYYPQSLRPDDACIINFNQKIEDISALGRALDFGNYGNLLGTLKFASGNIFYIVNKINILPEKLSIASGEIVKVDNNCLSIAAANGIVELSEITDFDGNPVSINSLGLKAGDFLKENFNRELLDKYYKECAFFEMFWGKSLQTLHLIETAITGADNQISSECISKFELSFSIQPGSCPATVFVMFLARISGEEEFDIPLNTPYPAGNDFPGVFARVVPMRAKVDLSKNAEANHATIEADIKKILDKKSFPQDIYLRHNNLNENLHKLPQTTFVLKINQSGSCSVELYQQTADKFIACFENFCANLKKYPAMQLSNISILNDAEQSVILAKWNETECDFDLKTPYIREFEKLAERFPEKCAVKSPDGTLNYGELNRRANCIAHHLLRNNLNNNLTVGVLTGKTLEMAVAILAIFKAGCTYMPLDVQRQTPERIEAMIYDSNPEIILSALPEQTKITSVIPQYIKIIDLTKTQLYADKTLTLPPEVNISTDDTAYIMYTSGSTGVPKGIMVSQRNLLNHNYSVIKAYSLTSKDNVLQFSTLGFDISIEEIFPTWLSGGSLIFMPDRMLESFENLFAFIKQQNITLLNLPTAYWHAMADAIEVHKCPNCVRTIVIGGEKASPERFARWRKFTPETKVINTYGPTETTVIATLGDNAETIGRPIANTHVYVLDKLKQPVPVGLEGELYIAGENVAKGYLNKPAETAAAFMDNPFVKNERMYRTGDKVMFTTAGELLFTGRIDDQFKIRGFRIEPDDIETVLSRHPDINTTAIRLCTEIEGSKSIVACFVPSSKNYNIDHIREFAKTQLPDYMIPAHFIAIDTIPLTPNGKINRKALPVPQTEITQKSNSITEPQSPLEMQLRLIFSKVLRKKNINTDASLISLGVDSLSAIKLLMEIESHTGIKIPFEELYSSSTINSICNYIRNSSEQKYIWSPVVRLSRGASSKPPLFLIHTTPGDILGYINLAHYLDDRDVHGIQSLGLYSPDNAHKSIEEMARYYVSEILEIYPEGPYLLCGWCFGGTIAYEMAQQLKKQGRHVAFLGLLETHCQLKKSIHKYQQLVLSAVKWGPKNCAQYLIFKLKRKLKLKKNQKFEQLDFISQRFTNSWNKQTIDNMKNVYRHNMNAQSKYCVEYYDGKISLFMSKETLKGKIPLPCYGWQGMSKAIELYTFKSGHDDILREPHVALVAEKIIKSITDAGC